ncbi:MAG: diguanylate cyclase, partial [Cyanobacteria bacterium J06632_3]
HPTSQPGLPRIVRRGLLSVVTPQGERKLGLGTLLALIYLEQEGIYPEVVDDRLHLGQGVFERFESTDGGYENADDGGTQILINFPAGPTFFETVSLTEVLSNQVPSDVIKDRVVLIGSVAVSINDFFYTPISLQEESPGVFIHAHIVSQLLGSALDGRTVLHGAERWVQWLWIGLSSNVYAVIITVLLRKSKRYRFTNILIVVVTIPCLAGAVTAIAYGFFNIGLWVPVATPLISIVSLATLSLFRQNQKLHDLAALDELTQISNRRTFDQVLQEVASQQQDIALVLCDIDFFKRYNDTYGHQTGDYCLRTVAQALDQGSRRTDLVARYGGEEFAIIFPNTSLETAHGILQQVKERVAKLEILHRASDVSNLVTLSFGLVAAQSFELKHCTPQLIIKKADEALYEAKRRGRNQIVSADLHHFK